MIFPAEFDLLLSIVVLKDCRKCLGCQMTFRDLGRYIVSPGGTQQCLLFFAFVECCLKEEKLLPSHISLYLFYSARCDMSRPGEGSCIPKSAHNPRKLVCIFHWGFKKGDSLHFP